MKDENLGEVRAVLVRDRTRAHGFVARRASHCTVAAEKEDMKNVPVTREMLIDVKENYSKLVSFMSRAVNVEEIADTPVCFYVKSGILMRKFRPPEVPASETWREVHQNVVPTCYKGNVLHLSHDHIGGHLGVKKTLDKILRYFYWPGITSDVAEYCKSCHICQLSGKPNQGIKPGPLHPIPVMSEPLAKVIIDVVGLLPKTRGGNEYMLTIMCTTTRYPEAIPLRRITSKSIIPILTRFFTQFGLPRVVQSDQGSNFTSAIFQQVMATLGIKQYLASAYHPESQGALERFHQTLKSMLTKFCLENTCDWDEGIPYVLYAIRSAKQESLGYSPYELLFGRDIRGPLKLLQESRLDERDSVTLSEYVVKMKDRLKSAQELAKKNLLEAQTEMKRQYDKDSVHRSFQPGDKVVLFMPFRRFPLQAKYQGPFKVFSKESDVNCHFYTW